MTKESCLNVGRLARFRENQHDGIAFQLASHISFGAQNGRYERTVARGQPSGIQTRRFTLDPLTKSARGRLVLIEATIDSVPRKDAYGFRKEFSANDRISSLV